MSTEGPGREGRSRHPGSPPGNACKGRSSNFGLARCRRGHDAYEGAGEHDDRVIAVPLAC